MKFLLSLFCIFQFINKADSKIVLFYYEISNFSDREIKIWRFGKNGNKEYYFKESKKGFMTGSIKFEINNPSIVYFNDYLLYVHPNDTAKIIYKRQYSSGGDSFCVKGRNSKYYTFFYNLKKARPNTQHLLLNYTDSAWLKYKESLIKQRDNEILFLKEEKIKLSFEMPFYLIANNEIKYQYFINCLLPNYGFGFNQNNREIIPSSFYTDISINDFNYDIYSTTYFSALALYSKYLTDLATEFQLSRYSNDYLLKLYQVTKIKYKGVTKINALLNILSEYQILNSQQYSLAYSEVYKKMIRQYKGKPIIQIIDSVYNLYAFLGKPIPKQVLNTELVDLDGNKITFGDFLQVNKGKIIYIDFWATWCAPCVEEMPNSIAMQKEFSDKDVVFLYLSLDSKSSTSLWKKISKKLNIELNQYMVVNDFESKLSEYINVGAIPVYSIIDKNQTLVSKSAPRPNTLEAKEIINKYLLKWEH